MDNDNNNNQIAISFDGQLVANSVTALLQMQGDLEQNEFLIYNKLGNGEEEGSYVLIATKQTEALDS
jgi:hypothetical protein